MALFTMVLLQVLWQVVATGGAGPRAKANRTAVLAVTAAHAHDLPPLKMRIAPDTLRGSYYLWCYVHGLFWAQA